MKIYKVVLLMGLVFSVNATALADIGNRYGLPQLYHSEISAAEAYLLTTHDRGRKHKRKFAKAVIIDVRRISEHLVGHPPKS